MITTPRFKNVDEFIRWWDEVYDDPTSSLMPKFQSADVLLVKDLATKAKCRLAVYFRWINLEGHECFALVRVAQKMGLLAILRR